jgi:nucleotide-binding universal stress UspA family protein
MFSKLLVPVNLTEADNPAVDVAGELATPGDGSVTLLHVIETIRDVPFEDLEDFYQRLEEKAREGMAELAARLATADLGVEQRVVYGRRAQEIVTFAEQREVDLIVLTSRPPDPEHMQEIWGNISHQVMILARCPVLLIK